MTLEASGPEPVTVASALFNGGSHTVKAVDSEAALLRNASSGGVPVPAF